MTINKAIEILKEHVAWCDPVKEVDTYDALKLGIEAMAFVRLLQHLPGTDGAFRLHGQTEDE